MSLPSFRVFRSWACHFCLRSWARLWSSASLSSISVFIDFSLKKNASYLIFHTSMQLHKCFSLNSNIRIYSKSKYYMLSVHVYTWRFHLPLFFLSFPELSISPETKRRCFKFHINKKTVSDNTNLSSTPHSCNIKIKQNHCQRNNHS